MTLTTPALDRAAPPRSAPAPPTPLAPLSGAVVAGDRVPFSWTALPGARRYTLQIAADRQFTHDVAEVDAGPSTEVLLESALPASGAPRYWRVRAETAQGPTRWSPYGRFVAGSDKAADAYRAEREAERAATAREAFRRRAEEQAARDLVPYFLRDDTIPSDAEAGGVGIAMILSVLIFVLAALMATTLG
jgi:hypothetical protein